MSNIRKQFNFRNGLQVDDDNLVISPAGLVGIGTTIPTETLDIRGISPAQATVKVVGLVTANQIYTPTLTATNVSINSLSVNSILGAGLSLSSGIVTSSSVSGIVTYYGDGGKLLNLPTSQWLDVDVGLGFTSIYAQGFVGVATNDPRFAFQVGGNNLVSSFENGVGINNLGEIYATGIVTASKFVGIGSNLTLINADNISSGTISTDRIPQLPNSKLPSNINSSGIITASGGFIGNLTGNVTGNLVGIASTARDLTSDARLNINSISCNVSNIGVSTIGTRLDVIGSVGVGTSGASGYQSDIHVSRTGISSIQISSQNSESYITLSRGFNQNLNAAAFKYGNQIGIYPYSTINSLDIINYDAGNVNNYIHLGVSTGISTGGFNWIYGKDSTNTLMTLTYTGNLGLGNTNPTVKLDVVGDASISGTLNANDNVSVGSSLTVNNLYVTGTASIPGLTTSSGGTTITENFNLTSGVSTAFNLDVSGSRLFLPFNSSIGIGTTQPTSDIQIGIGEGSVVISSGGIGIGTTSIPIGIGLDARNTIGLFESIGLGTDFPVSSVDFALAGVGVNTAGRFLRLPSITSSVRTTINSENDDVDVQGGIVFNSSTNTFEGFVGAGSSWVNLGIQTSRINSDEIKVGTGVTVNSGIVTATNGFNSGIGTAVKITTVGNRIFFTVPGVGSTSLVLY